MKKFLIISISVILIFAIIVRICDDNNYTQPTNTPTENTSVTDGIAELDVNEVELILPVPSPKSSNVGLPNELSIELPERLSKGLSETAATIYKLIYADNYITRGDIAKKVGISVTAVQKHVNKLKSIRLLDREGSASHGHWIIIEA